MNEDQLEFEFVLKKKERVLLSYGQAYLNLVVDTFICEVSLDLTTMRVDRHACLVS